MLAEAVGGSDQGVAVSVSWIEQFVDDWCGDEPIPVPIGSVPDPWRPVPVANVHPVNLVVAGALFDRVAEVTEARALQDAIARAADRLIETGLFRLRSADNTDLGTGADVITHAPRRSRTVWRSESP